MSLEEELRAEASSMFHSFISGAISSFYNGPRTQLFGLKGKKLDFSQYVGLWTITGDEIAIDDPERRLIIVGDVHGMDDELEYDERVPVTER